MDSLHLSIALGPLAVYALLVGMLNLSWRPFLTTGARDTAALGIAIGGLVVAGPMELFLPESAVLRFGPLVWPLLLVLYALCLTLLVLLMRPRLVIYNTNYSQLRPLLSDLAHKLDPESRWAGESLVMPRLGVQLTVESLPLLRNVQLVSAGPRQSYAGWRRLEIELVHELREARTQPSPSGLGLVAAGLAMSAWVGYCLVSDGERVASGFADMLRL